jgi:hypothetical protein
MRLHAGSTSGTPIHAEDVFAVLKYSTEVVPTRIEHNADGVVQPGEVVLCAANLRVQAFEGRSIPHELILAFARLYPRDPSSDIPNTSRTFWAPLAAEHDPK